MNRLDRRTFLGTSLGGLAALSTASFGCAADAPPADPKGRPDTLFLTWQRDPTTTMSVQWIGGENALADPTISYSLLDKDEWQLVAPRKKPYPMSDLTVFRAELTGLSPGTEYKFRLGNQPNHHRFRSMPAKATDSFSFVSGGDCGTNNHAVANNMIAARQDPMFALVGGDLGYDNGRDLKTSLDFMRNYSQHMVDTQGRLVPMVVCIGNHEVNGGYGKPRTDAPFYFALHDGLFADHSYAALDFGDYLSLVLLDTGHVSPIGGEQADWLDKTLAERAERANLIVANHVPAYPSVRPFTEGLGTGSENRKSWVPLFEKYNVDVVLEHHDHAFKRTYPMKDGHIDEKQGILYLGDGSWGKLRAPAKPDARPYLAATSETYHMTLHRLEGEQKFHMAIDESGKIIDVCSTQKKPRRRPVG
ncbi:MAG: metallophosphoesterase family protein [Planctomycetia bacterium]|nr:metallophosphoesterase family protein [Planctomycetia bacterium]